MLSRLLARLVTGPLAFGLAGAVDLAGGWGRWAGGRLRARVRARARALARLPRKDR